MYRRVLGSALLASLASGFVVVAAQAPVSPPGRVRYQARGHHHYSLGPPHRAGAVGRAGLADGASVLVGRGHEHFDRLKKNCEW